MPSPFDSIHAARTAFLADPIQILHSTQASLANSNSNANHNTYLWQDEAQVLSEAQSLAEADRAATSEASPLRGIPVSVKDCFDLAGSPTTCGTKFYRDLNGIAARDSWLVEKLRSAGAVITGKTHLHPLAYGITGENPDFGDCYQPGNPTALTGGSSSGAAASVMEGSSLAAIGTDTGGSVRVPAALCGLAGYRASLGRGDWRGGAHLHPSTPSAGSFAISKTPHSSALSSDQPMQPVQHFQQNSQSSPKPPSTTASPKSSTASTNPSANSNPSASPPPPSKSTGGPTHATSSPPSRPPKPHRSIMATSLTSSPQSANAWNGAQA